VIDREIQERADSARVEVRRLLEEVEKTDPADPWAWMQIGFLKSQIRAVKLRVRDIRRAWKRAGKRRK